VQAPLFEYQQGECGNREERGNATSIARSWQAFTATFAENHGHLGTILGLQIFVYGHISIHFRLPWMGMLQKQQPLITKKKNFHFLFLFAASKRKFAVFIFPL
jgi:hypothetical protein